MMFPSHSAPPPEEVSAERQARRAGDNSEREACVSHAIKRLGVCEMMTTAPQCTGTEHWGKKGGLGGLGMPVHDTRTKSQKLTLRL
jgi:hypothetical protein